ncbi:hypothetical protein D3C77_262960 [compost metagenome]
MRQAQVKLDEARHGYVRLVAVLLEELPLQYLGAQARLAGQEFGAIGEKVQDRVGFPQVGAVFKLQHWHLAIGVHGQKRRGFRLALEDIHRMPFIRQTKQVQHQLDLVAVTRLVITVNLVHLSPHSMAESYPPP